jgi:hypothetical protein
MIEIVRICVADNGRDAKDGPCQLYEIHRHIAVVMRG